MCDKNHNEWTWDKMDKRWLVIDKIAREKYGLEYNAARFEVVTYEQMIELMSTHALPNMYNHWSFGRDYINLDKQYRAGKSGLAYEVVINTNPATSYLMENNSMLMQTLVMAHAACGHADFFKNNYMFKDNTNANSILGFLSYSKEFIQECEEKYGESKVESVIDCAHALRYYSIDYGIKDKGSSKRQHSKEMAKLKERTDNYYETFNVLWSPEKKAKKKMRKSGKNIKLNVLKYIEDNSPALAGWEREILRIVRTVYQYLYPQMMTKIMNEGWASFWHYTLMHDLYDAKEITEGDMFEFYHSHGGVLYQPDFDSPFYSGLNPYTLGFNMFLDLRRICEHPDEEDKALFPEIAGTNWVETLKYIRANYNDSSFIAQFLSPKMIRKFRLFTVLDDQENEGDYKILKIEEIHNEDGYRSIALELSKQQDFRSTLPLVGVIPTNLRKTRTLKMAHLEDDNGELTNSSVQDVLSHVTELWGGPVKFYIINKDGDVETVVER